MKINLNAVGFSDVKWINVTEKLNGIGIVLGAVGLCAISAARYLNGHSVEWNVGTEEGHVEGIKSMYDQCHCDPET